VLFNPSIDQHIDDKADNRGIQHLPNLEFKFVTANTLLGLPETEERDELIQPELFDNYEKIEELKDVRDQYFSSYGIEREQLKSEFSKTPKRLGL